MKKIIITDPCYLLNRDEWKVACEWLSEIYDSQKFGNKVKELLEKHFEKVDVAKTGYGDWVNNLSNSKNDNFNVIQPNFCADAGMVCAVVTEDGNESLKKLMNYPNKGIGAVIELSDDIDINLLDFNMDTSNQGWTVVKVNYDNILVLKSAEEYGYELDEEDEFFIEKDFEHNEI